MCIQYNTVLFEENLRARMAERSVSEEELAAKTGILDFANVPEIQVLAKVCRELDCSIKSLMS